MSKTMFLIVPFCMLFTASCSKPNQALAPKPLCLNYTNEQAMKAAEKVLGRMQFILEKNDREAGYIRTRPLAAAQYFQFWRRDNADAYTAAKANLHSLRRVVEINLNANEGAVCINCSVMVQRLSIPERPIESMSNVATAFTGSDARTQGVQVEQSQLESMEWLDDGKDIALERKILNQIEKQLLKGKK